MKKPLILFIFIITGITILAIAFRSKSLNESPRQEPSTTEVYASDTSLKKDHSSPSTEKAQQMPRTWQVDLEGLESAALKEKPELEGIFKLINLYPTRNGYRATPTIDGREIFGQHSEYRKTDESIKVFWRELPFIQKPKNSFPSYDEAIFTEKILEYFSLRSSCETPNISNFKEYWYMRDTGNLEPTATFRVTTKCSAPRENIDEMWIYSLKTNDRIK